MVRKFFNFLKIPQHLSISVTTIDDTGFLGCAQAGCIIVHPAFSLPGVPG